MNIRRRDQSGFTLIEMVIVIIILGILGTIATVKMSKSIRTAQFEQTKREMEQLAFAIVGNPGLYTEGARAGFGYVGDVGAFPPNLDALVENPGGYTTWDGPYIARGMNGDDFKKDGWHSNYIYTDTLLRSTGSGSNIDQIIATSNSQLFNNLIAGVFRDANKTIPSTAFADSVLISVLYPDGAGSVTLVSTNPNAFGEFAFSGVPVGNHQLKVIYIPDTDTVDYAITVLPDKDVNLDIVFPADLW